MQTDSAARCRTQKTICYPNMQKTQRDTHTHTHTHTRTDTDMHTHADAPREFKLIMAPKLIRPYRGGARVGGEEGRRGGEEGGRRGGRRGGRTRGRSNARGRGTGRPHRAIPRKGEEVGTKKSPVDCKAAVDGDREPQKKARRGPAPVAPGRAALHKLSALLRQEHAGLRRPDPAQLTPPHAHQPAERSTSIAGVGAAGVGAAGEGAAGVGAAGVGAARVGVTGSRSSYLHPRGRTHSGGGLLRWPPHSPPRRSG